MGRPYSFRRRLATLGERYLLAVPANTAMRDLEVEPPKYSGRGRRPGRPWYTVETWSHGRDDEAWQHLEVRDGSKGPLVVEALKRRVVSRTHRRQPGDQETLVVIRYRDRDQQEVVKVDYYLSNATPETPLWEFARVAKAVHRIEECIQRSKSEAGLADYEVRNWTGWQRHQTLSLLTSSFLIRETKRGKKIDLCDDLAANSAGRRDDVARGVSVRHHTVYAKGAPEATCNAMSLLACITGNSVTDYPR